MLKLVSQTGNAARKAARPMPTPAQSRATVLLATISRAWQTLTPQQRTAWNAFGQVWTPDKTKTTTAGFRVFQSLNNVRMQMGATTLLTDAPLKPDMVTELPRLSVTAQNNAGTFSLTVQSAAYAGTVRVCAARPLSPGVTKFNPNAFRQISVLTGLTAGTTDIAAAYLSRFPTPTPGIQIAVMLCPVTANGFKGQSICLPALVTSAKTADGLTLSEV